MPEPFVSVVITVRNVERTISQCLDSLIAMDFPNTRYEIVIVDAKSTDRTQELIGEYAKKHKNPKIRLVEKEGYIGAGRNEGFKQAKGDFVAVTDADMEVSKGWLKEHLSSFEKDVGGTGGPNNNAEDTLFTNTIACLDIHGPSNDVVPFRGENIYGQPFKSKHDVYTTVCRNSCYRRKVLEEVGGMDERLVATEDPEMNQRILKAGYALKYNPKAVVYHHHRTGLGAFYRQQKHYAFGQAVANVLHPEMFKLVQIMPLLAFILLAEMLALSLLFPFMLVFVLLVIVGYVAAYVVYGLKCATRKGDMRMVLTMPICALIWHLAWVVGYADGIMHRKGVLDQTYRGDESHS